MRKQFVTVALYSLLVCLLSGCAGYQFGAKQPSILGDGSKTLKVKEIDYPTLQPWLPFVLRSSLRDKINERYLAQWVDSGPADYEISLKVTSFTTHEWARDIDNNTLLYDTNLTVDAIVYSGSTNKEVWRSGPVRYADIVESPDEKKSANEMISRIMDRIADKMRNTF